MSCHQVIGVLLCVGWAYMCTHSTYVYVCVSVTLYVCVRMCIRGYHVHVLFVYIYNYVCAVVCAVPLCVVLLAVCCVGGGCVLCVVYNITKLTYPLTVSGDGVLHELPSVSVSV